MHARTACQVVTEFDGLPFSPPRHQTVVMDDLSTLAGRLAFALRMRGMKQSHLDEQMGMSQWATRVASGKTRTPQSLSVAKAAQILGVPREWLESGAGDSGLVATDPKHNDDPRYDARDALILLLGERAHPREVAALRAKRLRDGDAGDAAWWRAHYAAIRADRIATDALLAALDEPVPAAVERPAKGASAPKARKKGA